MAWTENTPLAPQRVKDTQPLIRANWPAIAASIGVNHYTFGTANEGKHRFLQMPAVAPASVTTAADEGALYVVNSALTSRPELAFQRPSNGDVIEFTVQAAGTGGFYTILPSGIILKYGTATTAASSPFEAPINLDGIGTAYTTVFAPLITPSTSSNSIWIQSSTTSTLTVESNAASQTFFFYVIGV